MGQPQSLRTNCQLHGRQGRDEKLFRPQMQVNWLSSVAVRHFDIPPINGIGRRSERRAESTAKEGGYKSLCP